MKSSPVEEDLMSSSKGGLTQNMIVSINEGNCTPPLPFVGPTWCDMTDIRLVPSSIGEKAREFPPICAMGSTPRRQEKSQVGTQATNTWILALFCAYRHRVLGISHDASWWPAPLPSLDTLQTAGLKNWIGEPIAGKNKYKKKDWENGDYFIPSVLN